MTCLPETCTALANVVRKALEDMENQRATIYFGRQYWRARAHDVAMYIKEAVAALNPRVRARPANEGTHGIENGGHDGGSIVALVK